MSMLDRATSDLNVLTRTVPAISIVGADFDTLLHVCYALMTAITRVRHAGGTPDAKALFVLLRAKKTLHRLKGEGPLKDYPGLFLQRLDDFK